MRLYEILVESSHPDDTLTVFTNDNGPPFPGAKANLYDTGAKVPLMARHLEVQRRGVVSDAVVTFADITHAFSTAADRGRLHSGLRANSGRTVSLSR